MPEISGRGSSREIKVRHRGRGAQVFIYLGKLLRMFVYESDWKVLPMSALIAGLVGMVIRKRMFLNMEGCLMGSFALVCVCIWNGCFNSIQVICRERDVIKREHRSGMHISSYIFAHMLYQAIICLLQTGVTLYVTKLTGVMYPSKGLFTRWLIVDFGISMFLITYASDMLSLWVSSLAHSTTTAMTVMPFVLIFQLVFSGGMLTLPEWSKPLTYFTISNPGLKVITAQSDYNKKNLASIWTTIDKMRNSEVGGTFTVGQILDILSDTSNPVIQEIRAKEVGQKVTVGEIAAYLNSSASFAEIKEKHFLENISSDDVANIIHTIEASNPYMEKMLTPQMTVMDLIDNVLQNEEVRTALDSSLKDATLDELLTIVKYDQLVEQYKDVEFDARMTIGEIIDAVAANGDVQAYRDEKFTVMTTLGKVIELLGPDKVKEVIEAKAAEASYNEDYENTRYNIFDKWIDLITFVFIFAALATISLEFVDRDKR